RGRRSGRAPPPGETRASAQPTSVGTEPERAGAAASVVLAGTVRRRGRRTSDRNGCARHPDRGDTPPGPGQATARRRAEGIDRSAARRLGTVVLGARQLARGAVFDGFSRLATPGAE